VQSVFERDFEMIPELGKLFYRGNEEVLA